jgi:hypothetical protein
MSILDRIAAALLWIAAFALAAGVFLSATLLLRGLPPTEPVAIGLITILRYSKLADYVAAALFFLAVPPLTIVLRRAAERELARLRRLASPRVPTLLLAALLSLPLLLSPIFFLTTGKVGWILILPLALAYLGPRALIAVERRRWLRDLFRVELRPFHALLFAEGLSWILFRYLVTGRRIAHYPTLFLEVVFVAFFLALFTAVAVLLARLASFHFGTPADLALRRIAVAGLPMVLLPFIALFVIPVHWPRTIVSVIAVLCIAIAWRVRTPLSSRAAWQLAAYLIFPVLIYLVSYASTAQLSQWVDLFHRGETIGPASDYLRGKVPYRDVFALHGMLEDGLLDGWLMTLFGRSLDVAIARNVILGACLGVSLWFLGIVLFDSIPLAAVVVAMSAWTTAENNRTFFQVAAVALFVNGLRGSALSMLASGVFAGVAFFFSYDIGLFTTGGAIAAFVILAIARKRVPQCGAADPAAGLLRFLVGLAIGAAPFAIYLAVNGALDDFLVTSFVTIPKVIDATWSLPFPDIVSTFRKDLNLHTLAEFVLLEKFHLILSPLTIAIAAVYCIQRWLRRKLDPLDVALLVLAIFATVAQRTAFGRAEFRHQYFAAFLIGPLLVILAILLVRALRRVWSTGDAGTRAFIGALAVAALPMMAVLFWIPDLVNARIGDLIGFHARVLRVTHEPHSEETRWRIEAVATEIQRLTKKNEPIFDFSNQPAFYFFADRPNPTRFYQVPILSPRDFQAEAIAALEKAKPKVVIRTAPEGFDRFDGVPNALRAQAVAAYLDDTYRFHKSALGVELWTRARNAEAAPVERYLARIRLPAQRELAAQGVARIVFPAVGSIPGANDTYWVSDLTLHNPFRDPLEVKLRYVAGDVRLDRALTLSPRQTMAWPDVVRTFFRAPSGIGTLWIWHRTGRAPVAVVKTYDAVHKGRAAVEAPLTQRDAATANSDSSELTIVGVPSIHEAGRRVNVGVVNVGMIPATFRITVRTRNGSIVGKPVESGVPEDEVWLVRDLEHELGATLDESTTIRITAIAGTGVGFATVIEPNGDNQFIAAVPAQQQ